MTAFFYCISFVTVITAIWLQSNKLHVQETAPGFSSVWCHFDLTGNKICKFSNLVYSNNSFRFNLTGNSAIIGCQSYKDFQSIQLSSIPNHNRFFANISLHALKCNKKQEKVFVLAKFKPDNLMHVIHDDLLPLFVTLETICNLNSCPIHLMVTDDLPSPYNFLYELFAKLIKPEHCTEFEEIHMGLNLQSVWYQYGYGRPRGPVDRIHITTGILKRFRTFILSKLNIKETQTDQIRVVIFNRPSTRKILNIQKVLNAVGNVYKNSQVTVVDVIPNGVENLIKIIVNTDMLIGMHGAEMILALFLPKNAQVVELFPYGISSKAVSFLKPLSDHKLAHFQYTDWENHDGSASIYHPEYPAHLGGVSGLEKITIKKIDSVVCCNDPGFLHLMYQDTIIGDDFQQVFHRKFNKEFKENDWEFPDPPYSVTCLVRNNLLTINWKYDRNSGLDIVYSLLIQVNGKSLELQTADKSVTVNHKGGKVLLWISTILLTNNHTSKDVYVVCNN